MAGSRLRRRLLASGLAGVLLTTTSSHAEQRAPYVHVLGGAAVGRSLRFNNPYRLQEPLGSSAESVSLAAPYLDLSLSGLLGEPWGPQHGLSLRSSLALSGISQGVFSFNYLFLWRLERGHALYGRSGPSLVMTPTFNAGLEAAAGAVYMVTGGLGVSAELVGSGYYGAATREVSATFVPLLSAQVGLVLDLEVLP